MQGDRARVPDSHTITSAREILEIACDESGAEGEKLIGGNTDVFAHASIHIPEESAVACIQEIRGRIRSPAQEYKANHLLREKHRAVLVWLLRPTSPIHGMAHVHLTDKAFFVVRRVVDLLLGDASRSGSTRYDLDNRTKDAALALYHEAMDGNQLWRAFLESANDLMRTRNRPEGSPIDQFFGVLDLLNDARTSGPAMPTVELLRQSRARAAAFEIKILDDPTLTRPLDPLIPAIMRTVTFWSDGGRDVAIVHDEQNALTTDRIDELKQIFSQRDESTLRDDLRRGRLTEIRLVDSRTDARVQLADFLAGVARKIASDALRNQGDAELVALLRPYVDECSTWADEL